MKKSIPALNAPAAVVALLVGLAVIALPVVSQVVVTPVPDAEGFTMERLSAFPDAITRLRVTSRGQTIQPNVSAVWVVDGTRPIQPKAVTADADGSIRVRWTSVATASTEARVVVVDQGQTGMARLVAKTPSMPVVFWTDALNRGEIVPIRYDFGSHAVGSTDTAKFRLVVYKGVMDGDRELPVRVDSIRVRNPQFRVIWRGSLVDPRPAPPSTLTPGIDYRVDIAFFPTSSDPVVDTLTVFHSGGIRQSVILVANRTTYQRLQTLFVLAPNGGEVLTPCQNAEVRWTGSLKGFNSYLEYSIDHGTTWNFIDSTLDTTYLWKVPSVLTDGARIRVTQRFQSTLQRSVVGARTGASAVAFDATGSYLAIAYQNGTIMEFDAETLTSLRTLNVQGSGSCTQLAYVGTSRSLVALIRRQGGNRDAIQRFDLGTAAPTAAFDLESGYTVAGFGIESSGTTMYVWSQLDATVRAYDATTFTAKPGLSLSMPIAAATMDRDELGVTFIDGSIARYAVPAGTLVSRFVTNHLGHTASIVNRMSIAPSRRFAVLAAQPDPPLTTPQFQASYIYDLASGRLIDIFAQSTPQPVTGIGFTGSENTILFGMNDGTAMRAYDLEALRMYLLPGSGHFESVNGLAIAPNGSTYVSVSSDRDPNRNAIMRSVATPEWDESDGSFTIRAPQASNADVVLASRLVGSVVDTTIPRGICNTGTVPIFITEARLIRGDWCTLRDSIDGDTIMPGACLPLRLRAVALDTGLLLDTLVVRVCDREFRIAIVMRGIDRNLTLVGYDSDFGDVCVGNRSRIRIRALRNDDAVPVTINRMIVVGGLMANFRVATVVRDTVIPPGATLEVDVEFYPNRLGPDTAFIVVGYEQSRSERYIRLLGRGVGVVIQSSHAALPFIDGIATRTVVLRNTAPYPATVVRATVSAGAPFTTSPAVPVTIGAGDSVEMTITYSGGSIPSDARAVFGYSPCGVDTEIRLLRYRGSATVTLPRLAADPRMDIDVPVTLDIVEDVPYAGVRPFELTMVVNPRIFLARQVTSTMGAARLVSQDVVDGMRHVRVVVDGDFSTGEVMRINGWAGMAEVDATPLFADTAAVAFGAGIPVAYVGGELRIVGLDPERRILPPLGVWVDGVFPNPVTTGTVTVSLRSANVQQAYRVRLRVLDGRGSMVVPEVTTDVTGGAGSIPLDVTSLPPGVYTVVVLADGQASTQSFVVL